MPPLRFLAPRPALVALAPVISFPDVPSIQFNDPGEGLIRQPQHLFNPLALAHLFVQLGTLLLRPLALATRLPIQGGTRQFDPGQSIWFVPPRRFSANSASLRLFPVTDRARAQVLQKIFNEGVHGLAGLVVNSTNRLRCSASVRLSDRALPSSCRPNQKSLPPQPMVIGFIS